MPRQKCPMVAAILNFKMGACFHFKPVQRISFCNAGSFKVGEMVYFNNETFRNNSLNMYTDIFYQDGVHFQRWPPFISLKSSLWHENTTQWPKIKVLIVYKVFPSI